MPRTVIRKGQLTATLFFVFLLGVMSWAQVSPAAASSFTISNSAIAQVWQSYGGANSFLGLPTTNTTNTTGTTGLNCGGGQYNNFQNNVFGSSAIVWSPSTGAHASWGPIRQLWANLNFECGIGFPTTEWTYLGTYSGWGQIWYQNYQHNPIFSGAPAGSHYSIFWASQPNSANAAQLSNGAWCTFFDGNTYSLGCRFGGGG